MRSNLNVISTIAVAILVFATVCLINPAPVRAGLMQIRFEFYQEYPSVVPVRSGIGFLQFEEIEVDAWVPINELNNFNYFFSVSGIWDLTTNNPDFTWIDDNGLGSVSSCFRGAVRIARDGPNAWVADWQASSSIYEYYAENDDVPSSMYLDFFAQPLDLPGYEGHRGRYMTQNKGYLFQGTFTTSVWFENPPQPVPIPPSAILLTSALLPIFGLKKWGRT